MGAIEEGREMSAVEAKTKNLNFRERSCMCVANQPRQGSCGLQSQRIESKVEGRQLRDQDVGYDWFQVYLKLHMVSCQSSDELSLAMVALTRQEGGRGRWLVL